MSEPPSLPDATEKPRRSPWSASRVVLVAIAGLFAAVGVHLKLGYDKAVHDAETLINALAIAEEQHIGGSLAGIDALLEELAATIRDGRHHDPQFTRDFAARLPSFPEIRFVGIVDANGLLLPQSWPPQPIAAPGIDVSARRYFTTQRDAAAAGAMVVGDPVIGLSSNERTLHLSRTVRDRAGRFAGVVIAAINPDIYAAFLNSILFDAAGSCGLIGTDGRMIARAPNHAQEFGRDTSQSDLFRVWLPRSPVGVAHLVAKTDGNDKLLAYRLMPEFSLLVTAGVSRDKALGPWRSMAVAELVLLGVFSGLLLYWARRIGRQEDILSRRQHLMEDAVAERSRELEQARAMAEDRAARLGWINDELKRLTLVTSHHLQEPLRSVVSCGQMIPRSLSPCPPELERAVDGLCREGLELKELLGRFERHVASLTGTLQAAESAAMADRDTAPPEEPPPPPDRPAYAARAIAAAIILALLAGTAWQARLDYRTSLQSAATLTNAVVNSIERHFQSSFRRIDNLLTDVAWAVEDGRHTHAEFRERLQARLQTMVEVRQLSVLDAAGNATQWSWTTDSATIPLRNMAERDFFRVQKGERRRGLLAVGQPRPEDAGRDRLLPLSHPLIGADGTFLGAVVALVEADLYARFLDTVLLDEDGGSAVITAEGRIVARAPRHEEKFGMDISASDLFTEYLPRAPSGIARLTSKADGNDKLMGYRIIDGFPLLVTSGYSDDRALAQWKLFTAMGAALAAVSSAILFAWAWRTDRHSHAMGLYRGTLATEVAKRTAGLAAAHHAADSRSGRLAHANEQLRELTRMIDADMQAPLRRLEQRIAEVEALAAGRNDECDHWLSFITVGGVHLRALLRDYRRFVATVSTTPRPRDLDCAELARGAAAVIGKLWGRVSFHIGALPRLEADSDMLLELFLQLFANAATHAARQRPVSVTVTAEPDPAGWRFTVADDGPGLPPINGEQLFRAFETAHNRDPDSTGLGLPLCRVIVQAHGGRIWATSRPGKGCDIHFVLPQGTTSRFPLAGNPAPA